MAKSIVEQLEDEVFKEEKIKEDIENKLSSNDSSKSSNNEAKSIKAKFTQIMYSNKLIQGEKEAKKDIYKALKEDHGIPEKVSKKVERLLEKGSVTEFMEEFNAIEQLYEKVRS